MCSAHGYRISLLALQSTLSDIVQDVNKERGADEGHHNRYPTLSGVHRLQKNELCRIQRVAEGTQVNLK